MAHRIVFGLMLGLLLSGHLTASTIAAECLSRCRHSCCRVGPPASSAGPHCAHPLRTGPRCALRGRCTLGQQTAVTSLPPLALAGRVTLRVPAGTRHVPARRANHGHGRARPVETPPPLSTP